MNENMNENLTATAADQATLPEPEPELVQCDCCGASHDPSELTETANGDLVCHECIEREYGQCDDCGKWFPRDELTKTGNWAHVCESCLDDSYFYCEDCGTYYPEDAAVEVNPDTRDSHFVCEVCADRYYRLCDDCGHFFDDNHISRSDAYHDICTNCDEDWCSCSECGEVMRVEDAYYDDDEGEYYCSDCAPSSHLYDYSYKPAPVFGTTEGDDGRSRYYGDDLTFGVELECDGGDSVSDALRDINRITDRCYCKHDGSLSNGYEIVTHPGTLAWHKERFPWADVCEASRNNGFRSHDTDTCGLHVHVGRDQLGDRPNDTAAKMSLITYRLKDWFVRFSRRGGESRWTKYTEPESPLGGNSLASLRDYYALLRRDRYRAVNVQNGGTVEVRIFRGTLVPTTVLACIELVSNLALYARDHELEDCLAVTWDELVHYEEHEELTDYCSRRMASLSGAEPNRVPVAEPLPELPSRDGLFPGGGEITLDDSAVSQLQPGDIVCCVASGPESGDPVGLCGLVRSEDGAWICVEWFAPRAIFWSSGLDLTHGRDGRSWGLARRNVRRVTRIGNHELSRLDCDLTLRVFKTYGLLPGDRVEVIASTINDAYRVVHLTGTYLLPVCTGANDVPLCEVSWSDEGFGHSSNGLLPNRRNGWRVGASNLRRVDN